MANRAYLYNTSVAESDPQALWQKHREPGHGYAVAAEAAYRIPVPWLCCFRPQDLRAVQVALDGSEGSSSAEVRLPCTTVQQALANLDTALPLFMAIAGDANLARGYWQAARDALRALPLPCLALDAIEVMFMAEDIEVYGELMAQALAGDAGAVLPLEELACYEGGPKPYPHDVFLAVAPGPYGDKRRHANAAALEGGWHLEWRLPEGEVPPAAPPLPAPEGDDLLTLGEAIRAAARAHDAQAATSFAFAPRAGESEVLKLLVSTGTDTARAVLKALFTPELEALRPRIEAVCRRHRLAWGGAYFGSDETRQRVHRGDPHYWLHPPGGPPAVAPPRPAAAAAPPPPLVETAMPAPPRRSPGRARLLVIVVLIAALIGLAWLLRAHA